MPSIAASAFAQSRSSKPTPKLAEPNQVRGDEITPQQQAAVERGLAWLASHQGKDGSYGGNGAARHAGITALAGLAFMQAGNLPGRGKYGDNVQKCLEYVLSCCNESGLITSDQSNGPMYGHG
ncbi:MAG TPA: prenyltransferase/squalene oxidase repeat-containing protein, partial [Pseudolysinimonas sp.]|nr:prenyltransferase/squalene oxidase repeat-containing protein [Pseudolysinimonas sp.]